MSGIIRIDMPKGVEEGSTSVSPQSPSRSSVSSPSISRKGAILIGYSVMVGKSVYNTAIQEIKDGGNEELATILSNIGTGVGIVAGAYATGGISLIPTGVSAVTQIYTREKRVTRENRARNYEASMRGARVNYNMGGGYE